MQIIEFRVHQGGCCTKFQTQISHINKYVTEIKINL